MNTTGFTQITSQQIFSSFSITANAAAQPNPPCIPGTIAMTKDGRKFRYVLAGAADLVVGNVIQAPAQITNHQQLTPSAASIGAVQIVATLGATAATLNQYAYGWAIIDTTPGLGYTYGISGHQAVLSGGVITLNLFAEDAIQVALTGSSRVTLQANPYAGVIQAPVTTLTSTVVGVAVYPIPAGQYGWIQTGGPCGVLINGTPAVGQEVGVPGTVAGAVDINSGTEQIVGVMMVTGVDTKVLPVYLTLD